jgi:hypothetical protein
MLLNVQSVQFFFMAQLLIHQSRVAAGFLTTYLQEDALIHPLLFQYLCFLMPNQFNFSLWLRSKFANKELQMVS